MKLVKFSIGVIDRLLNILIILFLVTMGLYAAYALWDNNTVYAAANDVQLELLPLKPDPEQGHSFEELLKLNSDVVAWIQLDNTNVDYPVVQGQNNLTYVNLDVYKEFALAGSIFIDSRNERAFTDRYSILYGHDMAGGKMFSDLQLYKTLDFFEANSKGSLITPDQVYELDIFACLLVNASNPKIFDPSAWQADIEPLLEFVQAQHLFLNPAVMAAVSEDESAQILALTTCTYEFSDARTVLLAYMLPKP